MVGLRPILSGIGVGALRTIAEAARTAFARKLVSRRDKHAT
jgi:hypothetical protein